MTDRDKTSKHAGLPSPNADLSSRPTLGKALAKATRPMDPRFALPWAAQAGIPLGTGTRAPRKSLMPSRGYAVAAAAEQTARQRDESGARIVNNWEAAASGVNPRDFERYRLQIELVPQEAQGLNLRLFLSDDSWAAIRGAKRTQREATPGGPASCELCGRGTNNPDCHEQWSYDNASRSQRLEGLWCLCKSCHAAKHLGHAYAVQKAAEEGAAPPSRENLRFDHAMARLQEVNGIDRAQADAYFRWALERQRERNDIQWRIDLDWLFDWLAQPEQQRIPLRWGQGAKARENAHHLVGKAAKGFWAARV